MKEILNKCSICGGRLEFKDKLNGILVCRNCGNEIISSFSIKEEKTIPMVQTPLVMECLSQQQLSINNKTQSKIKFLKISNLAVALCAIVLVLAVFGIILFSYLNEGLNLSLKNQVISMAMACAIAVLVGAILKINVKFKALNMMFLIIAFSIMLGLAWVMFDMFIFSTVA